MSDEKQADVKKAIRSGSPSFYNRSDILRFRKNALDAVGRAFDTIEYDEHGHALSDVRIETKAVSTTIAHEYLSLQVPSGQRLVLEINVSAEELNRRSDEVVQVQRRREGARACGALQKATELFREINKPAPSDPLVPDGATVFRVRSAIQPVNAQAGPADNVEVDFLAFSEHEAIQKNDFFWSSRGFHSANAETVHLELLAIRVILSWVQNINGAHFPPTKVVRVVGGTGRGSIVLAEAYWRGTGHVIQGESVDVTDIVRKNMGIG